jgi:hypothetical protein
MPKCRFNAILPGDAVDENTAQLSLLELLEENKQPLNHEMFDLMLEQMQEQQKQWLFKSLLKNNINIHVDADLQENSKNFNHSFHHSFYEILNSETEAKTYSKLHKLILLDPTKQQTMQLIHDALLQTMQDSENHRLAQSFMKKEYKIKRFFDDDYFSLAKLFRTDVDVANADEIAEKKRIVKGLTAPLRACMDEVENFFADTTAMKKQLAKLEVQLETRAGDRYDPVNRKLGDYVAGAVLQHRKLLSGYFRQWAAENGFLGIVKINSSMSTKDFASLLSSQSLFKDTAFRGTEHGEWSHLIQWWCLVEQHKEKPFLSIEPAELYRLIGEHDGVYDFMKSHWLKVFEGLPQKHTLRSVFDLNIYLQSADSMYQFPVLCQLITGREVKGKPPNAMPMQHMQI